MIVPLPCKLLRRVAQTTLSCWEVKAVVVTYKDKACKKSDRCNGAKCRRNDQGVSKQLKVSDAAKRSSPVQLES